MTISNQENLPIAIPTEEQLVSTWKRNEAPLVSIICHAFQQSEFIKDSIKGFLIQKTAFPFEIIIHDDASADGTNEIVKEYSEKYPRIIKTILQMENRYSKNQKPHCFTFPLARGKYVALCEGDDFWTSEDKLRTQVAKLEATPNASACFHSADDLDENTGELIEARWSRPFFAEEYSLDDLFEHGNFVPTASLVFRREPLGDLPALLSEVPHGDFAILAKLLTCGPLIYIDKSMSVYRRHSGGVHSSVWGPISTFRALKSRVNIGNRLGLQNLVSYQVGLKKLHDELENKIFSDQERIKHLETELQNVRDTYDRARQSKFFRLGVAIGRRLESIRSLMNRN